MPDNNKVVRHSRHEMEQYEGTAQEEIAAGYLVEAVGDDVSLHSADAGVLDRFLIAKDDRDRGMELGDSYAADDAGTKYLDCSGGSVHGFLDAGEAVDLEAADPENRLVSAGNGALRVIDEAGGDDPAAVCAHAVESIDNEAGDDPVAIAIVVVN